MRLVLLVGMIALLLGPGCSKPEDSIIGTWRIDIAALEKDPEFSKLEGKTKDKALELARKMMKDMSFEFAKDGALHIKFGTLKRDGTWKLKSKKEKVLTIATVMIEGETKKPADITIEVTGKDTVLITTPDKKILPFARR